MSLPSFDETALASLTEKIEVGLSQTRIGKDAKAAKVGRESSKTAGPRASRAAKTKIVESRGGSSTKRQKRNSDGESKQDAVRRAPTRKGQAPHIDTQTARSGAAALALGGDREDLALLEGVDSDSELDTGAATTRLSRGGTDKRLRKDLASFVKDLGIESEFIDGPDTAAGPPPKEDVSPAQSKTKKLAPETAFKTQILPKKLTPGASSAEKTSGRLVSAPSRTRSGSLTRISGSLTRIRSSNLDPIGTA